MRRTETPSYRYPDHGDAITKLGLQGSDPFPGYWVQSERRVLDLMAQRIKSLRAGFGKPSWMIDAGCGWGRLIPFFEGFFDRVLAVEPDPERLEGARRMAREEGLYNKTMFVCEQLQDLEWPEKSIDVAISSHVIQHVRTGLVMPILVNMARIIKANGILLLTTSHSTIGRDCYAAGVTTEHRAEFSSISKERFDQMADSPSDGLPVRFYAFSTLKELLENAGFEVLEIGTFQLMNRSRVFSAIDTLFGRDKFANAFSILKEILGSNVFVAARRVRCTPP